MRPLDRLWMSPRWLPRRLSNGSGRTLRRDVSQQRCARLPTATAKNSAHLPQKNIRALCVTQRLFCGCASSNSGATSATSKSYGARKCIWLLIQFAEKQHCGPCFQTCLLPLLQKRRRMEALTVLPTPLCWKGLVQFNMFPATDERSASILVGNGRLLVPSFFSPQRRVDT